MKYVLQYVPVASFKNLYEIDVFNSATLFFIILVKELTYMAKKTATIHLRVEPSLKTDAEKLLKRLGLSTTDAINIFVNYPTQSEIGYGFLVRLGAFDTPPLPKR